MTVTYIAREVAQDFIDERHQKAVQLVRALNRCEHGRPHRETCWYCPDQQSTGNLFLAEGQRIGTTLYGDAILWPGPEADALEWLTDGKIIR